MSKSQPKPKTRALTKDDLALAQALHHALEELRRHAERLDPERKRRNCGKESYLVGLLDHALGPLSSAFVYLTGKSSYSVHMTELSTEDPAAWTQKIES